VSEHISLRELTKNNIREVLALKVSSDQEKFVPSVGDMIARASVETAVWYKAICYEDTPVGFIKIWEENKEEPDLWGLMVDEKYQGEGYAQIAVELAIKEVKTHNPLAKRFCVGFLNEDGNARSFYEKLGFRVEREETFDGWTELIAYKSI